MSLEIDTQRGIATYARFVMVGEGIQQLGREEMDQSSSHEGQVGRSRREMLCEGML